MAVGRTVSICSWRSMSASRKIEWAWPKSNVGFIRCHWSANRVTDSADTDIVSRYMIGPSSHSRSLSPRPVA